MMRSLMTVHSDNFIIFCWGSMSTRGKILPKICSWYPWPGPASLTLPWPAHLLSCINTTPGIYPPVSIYLVRRSYYIVTLLELHLTVSRQMNTRPVAGAGAVCTGTQFKLAVVLLSADLGLKILPAPNQCQYDLRTLPVFVTPEWAELGGSRVNDF